MTRLNGDLPFLSWNWAKTELAYFWGDLSLKTFLDVFKLHFENIVLKTFNFLVFWEANSDLRRGNSAHNVQPNMYSSLYSNFSIFLTLKLVESTMF